MATIQTKPIQPHVVSSSIPALTIVIMGGSILLSLVPMALYPIPIFHYMIRGIAAVLITSCVIHMLWRNYQLQRQLVDLEDELLRHHERETVYLQRTRRLRESLHDLRSPISALQLSIDMLQRVSCDEDKRHLARMQASLEAAIDHVEYISAIQKGQTDSPPPLPRRVMQVSEELRGMWCR